jgi:hypothetical protein
VAKFVRLRSSPSLWDRAGDRRSGIEQESICVTSFRNASEGAADVVDEPEDSLKCVVGELSERNEYGQLYGRFAVVGRKGNEFGMIRILRSFSIDRADKRFEPRFVIA